MWARRAHAAATAAAPKKNAPRTRSSRRRPSRAAAPPASCRRRAAPGPPGTRESPRLIGVLCVVLFAGIGVDASLHLERAPACACLRSSTPMGCVSSNPPILTAALRPVVDRAAQHDDAVGRSLRKAAQLRREAGQRALQLRVRAVHDVGCCCCCRVSDRPPAAVCVNARSAM